MEQYLRVGVFANTHGVRGEIKLFPTTDDLDRFEKGLPLWFETRQGKKEMIVSGVKYFKNMVILKFEGIDNINQILPFKGCDVYVDRAHALALEEGEYFIADILGAKVVSDEGEDIGVLEDVMQTGANDVYVVRMKTGREVLLPVIPECVLDLDFDNKVIKVHMMPGLL